MDETIILKRFADIDLNDTFFDSLKKGSSPNCVGKFI